MNSNEAFLVLRAVSFTEKAHRKQTRKYTGEAYISHPLEVAMTLAILPEIEVETVCAALLHDVVEDCEIGLDTIARVFGDKIAKLVNEVSDRSRKEDGNRETRKRIDRDWYAKASPAAQDIKLADLISNTASIMNEDPTFARVYMQEKKELLDVLTKGHSALIDRACGQIQQWVLLEAAMNNTSYNLDI